MKVSHDYRPKYSLSINYLSKFMTPEELEKLIDNYVKAKKGRWKKEPENTPVE